MKRHSIRADFEAMNERIAAAQAPYMNPHPIGRRVLIGHRWVTMGEVERFYGSINLQIDQIEAKVAARKADEGGAE